MVPMPRRGASGSTTGSGSGPVLAGAVGTTTAVGACGSRQGSWRASDHHGDPVGCLDGPGPGGRREFQPSVTSVPPLVPGSRPAPRFQDDTNPRGRSAIDGPVHALGTP